MTNLIPRFWSSATCTAASCPPSAWPRAGPATTTPVAGLLQVGDLGYFPDPTRLDKATIRHAKDDPLELGARVVAEPRAGRRDLRRPDCPPGLWFTAGNHEDYDDSKASPRRAADADFVVDHYGMVRCVQDGRVADAAAGCASGPVGHGREARTRRTNLPPRGYIQDRAVDRLIAEPFDVLLTHDAPLDAKRLGDGSELLANMIHLARPAFAFFGHYQATGAVGTDYGGGEVYHMAGFELRDGMARRNPAASAS